MGLYSRKHLEDGAEIYVWEITETEQELKKICIPIPSTELEELKILKSEARRKEKLAVRALLNMLFDEKVYLGHHDHGKPYIQNNAVEISITHTNRFVAIITHPEENVGIDVESLERDFSAVEKKALSKTEINDLCEKHRSVQLAIYWSAKEAIYKRMSITGVDFAEQMEVAKFTPKKEGAIEAVFTHKNGSTDKFTLEYEIFENHVMVWMVG